MLQAMNYQERNVEKTSPSFNAHRRYFGFLITKHSYKVNCHKVTPEINSRWPLAVGRWLLAIGLLMAIGKPKAA